MYATTGQMTYEAAANLAMNEVFMRSLNTSLATLAAGGRPAVRRSGAAGRSTLKDLALALLVGLLVRCLLVGLRRHPDPDDSQGARADAIGTCARRCCERRSGRRRLRLWRRAGAASVEAEPAPAATSRERRARPRHRPAAGAGQGRNQEGEAAQETLGGTELTARAATTSGSRSYIRDIPDFPKPGVVFKDITPLLADKKAFTYTIDAIAHHYDRDEIDKVLGIEARGFMVAAPLAYRFTAGLIPVRKKGKLPWEVESADVRARVRHRSPRDSTRTRSSRGSASSSSTTCSQPAAPLAQPRSLTESAAERWPGIATIMELSFLGGRRQTVRTTTSSASSPTSR